MAHEKFKRSTVSFLFASIFLLSGCGGGGSSATETAEADSDLVEGGLDGAQVDGGIDAVEPEAVLEDEVAVTPQSTEVESALTMAAPLSPIMRSGFEAGTTGTPMEAITQLSGVDTDSFAPNDWSYLHALNPARGNGYFEIQYHDGALDQRRATLSPDPDNVENQTLEFWLHDNNDEGEFVWLRRGRIQANFYENYQLSSYYQSVRVRLGRDFDVLRQSNESFDWLTIFEAWNGANWIEGEETPFNITVNLTKPSATPGSRFHFKAEGRTLVNNAFVDVWSDTNREFAVPLEQWITLELYMREGDGENGRFYMTAEVDGGDKVVLFDEVNYTHHPDDLNPAGFDYINPMKLYTLEPVMDLLQPSGSTLEIHWDDLEFGHTATATP